MRYEDRHTISTPEGLELELTLAGLGSRMISFIIDTALQYAIIALAALVFILPTALAEAGLLLGISLFLIVVAFVLLGGYDISFEVLNGGRTPGKLWTGLRVVRDDGGPITLGPSAVRNLLRLVDGMLTLNLGYVLAVVFSSRNQRIGDMAAGTLVVRERRGREEAPAVRSRDHDVEAWDVATVSEDELSAVRRFLERRTTLAASARQRIAWELVRRLRPKVGGAPDAMDPESFLEALVQAKSSRR